MIKQSTNIEADTGLHQWADQIANIAIQTNNLSVGLVSGNRFGNDPRVIFRIVRSLQGAVHQLKPNSSCLLCRLDVRVSSAVRRLSWSREEAAEPKVERSALGNWHFVEVPIVVGNVATPSLQLVPRLLPKWKLNYNLVLIDLGPLHLVPSRIVGRLCDCNFVLLGPTSCASSQWINQFVSHHADCGSHITGTITAGAAA